LNTGVIIILTMARGAFVLAATASLKDSNNAECAILCMIDDSPETIDKQERTDALTNLITKEDLRYGSPMSKRPRYSVWMLQPYIGQLLKQVKKGVPETQPKIDIIWQKGSRALKSDYLERIGFKAYLKAKRAEDDEGSAGAEEEDDAQDDEEDSDRASVQENDEPNTTQKVSPKSVRLFECR